MNRLLVSSMTLVVCAVSASAQSPTVGNYQFVSESRIDRTTYLYTYRATLTNPGAALNNVSATVVSTSANAVIVDNSLTFGNVPAAGSRVSQDTFSFRQDRTLPFDSSKLVWTIQSSPSNRPPVANAGPDQTVLTTALVTLNGSGSSDPDGNPLTYAWTMTQRPAGSAATLSSPAIVNPTFTADKYGTYKVQLVVHDGMVSSPADEVVISTQNSAPVAHAGPDQTVLTLATVALNGSASTDVDGQPLTYLWSFVSRPAGSTAVLNGPTTATPTFTADKYGNYTVQLVVNDGFVNSAPDTVAISTQNTAPVANAGPDAPTTVGSTVTLNGSGSTDVDGQPLGFTWSFVSRPAGSAAALSNVNIVNPTFVADKYGVYVVQLIVNDGIVSSAPDTVQITTTNVAPTANAGPDQSVYVGNPVTLNGSLSSDPDGQPLTFLWSLTTKPAGSAATLSSPTAVSPTFTADKAGVYIAQLIVRDGLLDSAPDTVQITTLNSPPVANAGPDQTVAYLATVQLNGSASSDVDGNTLTHSWSFVSRPAGSSAALSNPTLVNPTFVADRPGLFVVQLIVNDGTVNSTPDTVQITTNNSAPTANAGPDQAGTVGQSITLTGALSSDPDGNPLTYAWSFTSRPAGSLATLNNPTTVSPTFTVDVGGTYVVQLIVSDGLLSSPPDTVVISTGNIPPVANAGPDQTGALVGGTVQLDGSGSSDADHNPLTYSWSLSTRPEGSSATLAGPTLVNPTFVPDRRGVYVAQLIVNDGITNSPSDTVQITTANRPPVANAGTDQTGINVNATVNLTGLASSDPDGDTITYAWVFAQRPSGSGVALTGASTATPSFIPDRGGLYRLQLTVNDGLASSTPDQVDVTVNNQAPTANAGPDQNHVSVGATVNLTGAGSSDPDGQTLTYSWSFSSRPGGSAAALLNPTSATPSFVPDLAGTYVVQLTVSDGAATSAPETVQITVVAGNIGLALADTGLLAVSGTANVLITLTQPAPSGGLLVTLTSDAPGIVSVGPPNTVTIPQGSSSGTLVLNGVSLGATTVRATAPTYGPGALVVSTTNNIISLPLTQNVPLGQTASIPINLSPAAPGGGLVVTVTSSDPSKVAVLTPTVTIGAGQVVGNISVQGVAPGPATILATASGYASDSTVATTTGELNITQTSATMTPGFPATLTVQLQSGGTPTAAPAPGLAFTITSANTDCVANGSGTIPTGLVNTSWSPAYGGVATLPCTTQITASGTGLTSDSINVTVNPNPTITVSHNGTGGAVGASLQVYASATLGISNHGGKTVHVESGNAALFTVSTGATVAGSPSIDIPVLDGVNSVAFYIHGQDGVTGSSTVTVSAPGFASGSTAVNVVQSALRILSLATSFSSQDADDPFYVETGIPNPGLTAFSQQQNARAGLNLDVTVSNSNATVARLTTSIGSAQSRTVQVAAGTAYSPTSVGAGGVAFDPLAGGTTTVSATAANFVPIPVSSVAVTVSGGTISFNGLPLTVGSGLMVYAYQASLSGSSHGGVTMRIESNNPALVKVSPDTTTASTDFFEQFVPNGSTTVNFYVHALEGASGPATITASAATFTSQTGNATVVPFAADIWSLTTTHDLLDTNDFFYVRVGIPSGSTLSEQSVRTGSAGIALTVTNSDAAVGRLTMTGGSAQTLPVTIPAGSGRSGGSLAAGGIEFDPVGVGSTAVTVSGGGMTAVPGSSQTVTVNPGTMSFDDTSTRVGAGLMRQSQVFRLSGSNHGGVDVTITSGDSGKVLLSLDPAIAGKPSITKTVPNGEYYFYYVTHGVELQSGAVTLTATATNFTNATSTATVVAPTFDIISLTTSTTSLSAEDPFYIRTATPTPALTGLSELQYPRAGHPVTFTVTNSDSTVAQLRTLAGSAQSRDVVAPGGANTPTSVAAGGIAFDPLGGGTTVVTATAPGFVTVPGSTVTVTVTSPGISIGGLPATVGSGLMQTGFSATLGGSNHGGVTVRVQSSNAGVILVSPNATTVGAEFIDVPVADGSTLVAFGLHAVEGALGTVTISVSAPGFTTSTGLATAARPYVEIISLSASQNVFGGNDPFQVRVGIGSGANLNQEQDVRYGSPGIPFTVSNSNAAFGQLHRTAGDSQSVVLTIPAGSRRTPSTVGAGGVEFDPLAVGATVVSVANPDFTIAAAGTVAITVSGGSTIVNGLGSSTIVGAGLMTQCCSVTLSGAEHGGDTITITSSDPARILVSENLATVGAASFFKAVANGITSMNFVIHGVEGAAGSATITVTATKFTSSSGQATVATPGIELTGLAATYSASAANDAFYARVGLPNTGNTALSATQAVRAGSGVTVTVTSTNVAVGQLVTNTLSGATVTVAIAAGSDNSPTTKATGGVEFDPLAAGTTFVQVAAPGFVQTNPGGNKQVTVN